MKGLNATRKPLAVCEELLRGANMNSMHTNDRFLQPRLDVSRSLFAAPRDSQEHTSERAEVSDFSVPNYIIENILSALELNYRQNCTSFYSWQKNRHTTVGR